MFDGPTDQPRMPRGGSESGQAVPLAPKTGFAGAGLLHAHEWVTGCACPDAMTFAAYLDDVLPAFERLEFDAHLARCPDCTLAVRDLRATQDLPEEPVAPESMARIQAGVLAALDREWAKHDARRLAAESPSRRLSPVAAAGVAAAGVFVRIGRRLDPRPAIRSLFASRRRALAAACLAALLAVPVVVYVLHVASSDFFGARKSVAFASSRGSETPSAEANAILPGGDGTGSARFRGPNASLNPTAGGMGEQTALRAKQPASQELLSDAEVQKAINELVAQAEVDAMLPHTDAEYEAWAREEYPHIMWLYDVLTQPQYGIEWNGEPASVPVWADRLYADVPAADRPQGWRALVVYSGEALRFDYPTDPSQPNVRPRLEAVQLAAAVAGFETKFVGEASKAPASEGAVPESTMSTGFTPSTGSSPKSGAEGMLVAKNSEVRDSMAAATAKRLLLPALTWAEHGEKVLAMSAELARPAKPGRVVAAAAASASNAAPIPAGYFAAVSARPETTQFILRYAAVSDLVVGTPATASLSREAQALLLPPASLGQKVTGAPSCTMTLPSSAPESVFSARRRLLANLAAQEGGSR